MRSDSDYKTSNRIYALYNFSVGYYFLRVKKTQVAREYYRVSLDYFNEEGLFNWAWRSQFNLFLCDAYEQNFVDFDKGLEDLMGEYPTLSRNAQFSFSRFLVWALLFRGKTKEAFSLCLKYSKGYEVDEYILYLEYVLNKKRSGKRGSKGNEFINVFIEATKSVLQDSPKSTSGQSNLHSWTDEFCI